MASILDMATDAASTALSRGAFASIKPANLLPFQFNPKLKHSMKPNWSVINAVHSDLPLGVFTSMGNHSISMDLWFDSDSMIYMRDNSVNRASRRVLTKSGGLLDIVARLQALVEPIPTGVAGYYGQNLTDSDVPLQAPEVYLIFGLRPPMRVRVDDLSWEELEYDRYLRPLRIKAAITLSVIPDSLLYKANKIAMAAYRTAGVADSILSDVSTTISAF